jgi:hypothetical protein
VVRLDVRIEVTARLVAIRFSRISLESVSRIQRAFETRFGALRFSREERLLVAAWFFVLPLTALEVWSCVATTPLPQ